MKVAISGGTGLVGRALTNELLSMGHEIMVLTRRKAKSTDKRMSYVQWLSEGSFPEKELEGTDAIVNLAGATINSRWTKAYKQKILNSRLQAADEINRILNILEKKPRVLINASAVGYYGTSNTSVFTESFPAGDNDFLAKTVARWESAVLKAEAPALRVVLCRFGVILDKNDGALPRMVLPYKFFIGGKIGSGKQWLSWIHLKDAVNAIIFALESEQLTGPVNITAPHPVTMDQFGKSLSTVLHTPYWLPVPAFMLKALLGEMSILVLEGQQVLPKKLLDAGFNFQHPKIKDALKAILEV